MLIGIIFAVACAVLAANALYIAHDWLAAIILILLGALVLTKLQNRLR